MNRNLIRRAFYCLAIFASANPGWSVTYTATILNPPGFDYDAYLTGISGSQQVGFASGAAISGFNHAILWSGTAGSAVDLNPPGFNDSEGYGISGTNQVGRGYSTSAAATHALLWNSTAVSAVDLHPDGFSDSEAHGVSGSFQVGFGFNQTASADHALLWSGTAASAIDLHPTAYYSSYALDVSDTAEVGYARVSAVSDREHALLWNGTAASAIDLNPSGFDDSYAFGVSGANQVGWAWGPATGGNPHAILWSGSAASFIDLHPAGFDTSLAVDISTAGQVGYGYDGLRFHALLWSGAAASAIDLDPFLSNLGPTFYNSQASAISDDGSITGYANGPDGIFAILWTPVSVPEPGSAVLILCAAAITSTVRLFERPSRRSIASTN
jgi:hypothetical protein